MLPIIRSHQFSPKPTRALTCLGPANGEVNRLAAGASSGTPRVLLEIPPVFLVVREALARRRNTDSIDFPIRGPLHLALGALCTVGLLACGDPSSDSDASVPRRDAEIADAMTPRTDGAILDGAVVDGAVVDGAVPDGGSSDGGAPMPGPGTAVGTPSGPSNGTGSAPIVLWPRPVHAHPAVPFDFTFVAYDVEHETIVYRLEREPAGMTIDAGGTLHWAAPIAGTHSFDVLVSDGRADAQRIPVSVVVDATQFLFVARTGRDAGTGTIDDPLRDPAIALARLRALGWGTLFVRGGTYPVRWNWEVSGTPSPLRGATGTAARPFVVRGYPGESVVLDCEESGHGLWSYGADYVVFSNLEVRRAAADERGGIMLDGHSVAQSVTVRDSNWSRTANCTGFQLRADAICHRCVAIDNYDRSSDHWNSSNYLVYASSAGPRTVHILDSYSEGSVSGFKIKHAGAGMVVFHGLRSRGDTYGFGVADDGTSVRYSTVEGGEVGITYGITDPSAFTLGSMTFEHNTVVDARIAFEISSGYGRGTPITVRNNIFHSTRPLGTGEGDVQMMFTWPYEDTLPTTLAADSNCYVAPGFAAGFRIGRPPAGSFTRWQGMGHDAASRTSALAGFFAAADTWIVSAAADAVCQRGGAWH